ncbi:hypothetical protein HZC30_00120 [Candidatus Woesearchaeota archaeon]|nr:hypothetical protein [Candidatus Woesearchaeota archaeon]
MGLLKKELYAKLVDRIAASQPNAGIVKVLEGLQEDGTLLTYLSLGGTRITIYEGSTNDESVDLCQHGLMIRDDERGVSRELRPAEINHYAVFLGQKGYCGEKIVQAVEDALEGKLKQN